MVRPTRLSVHRSHSESLGFGPRLISTDGSSALVCLQKLEPSDVISESLFPPLGNLIIIICYHVILVTFKKVLNNFCSVMSLSSSMPGLEQLLNNDEYPPPFVEFFKTLFPHLAYLIQVKYLVCQPSDNLISQQTIASCWLEANLRVVFKCEGESVQPLPRPRGHH